MNDYVSINRLEFPVSYRCNSSCRHCYLDGWKRTGRTVDPHLAVEVVRKVCGAHPVSSVMTFGGEPLLKLGLLCRIADRAAEAGARVIRHDVNQGYGSALNTGVRLSGCPYVAIIDGDGTYPTSNLAELSGLIPDYDMVVGARTG